MRKKSGFSLFELLLVTAFFAVAVFVFRPYYLRWKVRSTQLHALANLSNIFKIQQIYHSVNETYITDMEILKANGFEITEKDLYNYKIKPVNKSEPGYKVTATSKKKLAPCSKFSRDIWTMNEKKEFHNKKNGTIGCM